MALPSPLEWEPRPADSDALASDMLLPILRPRSALAMEALADRIFGESTAHVAPMGRIGPDLVITLAACKQSGAVLVEQRQLHGLGLESATAFEQSVANLLRRSDPRFARLGDGAYASDWNDGFDAARLLLVHLFAGLSLTGDVVAMVPTHGRLLVTGADDKNCLATMAEAAADLLSKSEQPLSAQPLRLHNGSWTSFTPDPAEFVAFQDLRRGQWIRDYAEQKQLLDQLHAQDDDQIHVADEVAMLDQRSGRPFCLTFWVDGVPSLLPCADVIGFKTASEVILVPWDAAQGIVGHHLGKSDHYPPRFRTERFPTPPELEQLRSSATLAKPLRQSGVTVG